MANLKSGYVTGSKPVPSGQGPELMSVNAEIDISAALALNDVLELFPIPAGHVPVAAELHTDDLDTGAPAITLDLGILNAGKTAVDTTLSGGAKWLAGDTVGQAGGMVRVTDKAIKRVTPDAVNDLLVGVVVAVGPGTGATSGKVGVEITYRTAHYNN